MKNIAIIDFIRTHGEEAAIEAIQHEGEEVYLGEESIEAVYDSGHDRTTATLWALFGCDTHKLHTWWTVDYYMLEGESYDTLEEAEAAYAEARARSAAEYEAERTLEAELNSWLGW